MAAGFDLYQLSPLALFSAEAPSGVSPAIAEGFFPTQSGFFDGVEVTSAPIGEFDFQDGAGPVGVGLADTIVRRDNTVVDPGNNGLGSTTIEIVALSLVSVEPVAISPTQTDHLFFELDPAAASTGSYEILFLGDDGGFVEGELTATLTLNYRSRIGAPDGPVHSTGSVFLGSQATPFTRFPEGLSPFNVPDHTIDGVNFFLNGQDQEDDLFVFADFPLALFNFDDGAGAGVSDFSFFELAYEPANADEPGSSADNPVLPEDQGGVFVFQDAPIEGWFDPPATSGYEFETDGDSNFVSVFLPGLGLVPDADGEYLVSSVHGDVVAFAGTTVTFPTPVDAFTITGIDPTVDGGDPLAFPTFLTFDDFSNTFTQTPIPEPAAAALGLLGVVGLVARRPRR